MPGNVLRVRAEQSMVEYVALSVESLVEGLAFTLVDGSTYALNPLKITQELKECEQLEATVVERHNCVSVSGASRAPFFCTE